MLACWCAYRGRSASGIAIAGMHVRVGNTSTDSTVKGQDATIIASQDFGSAFQKFLICPTRICPHTM